MRRLAGHARPRMRQQERLASAGAAGSMGGRATKQETDADSSSSSENGVELGSEISERLTLSMQDARVICRRPSAINGDILIEELLDEPSKNLGTTVRRMRFCR